MLSIILGILGSGGFGSIVGLVGGFFNRKLDLKAKELDLADKKDEREFNLKYIEKEAQLKLEVSKEENVGKSIDASKEIEVAGYAAMADSYSFAAPTSADGWIDKFSKAVRPVLTLAFFAFSAVIFYKVNLIVSELEAPISPVEALALWKTTIEWVLFQAGVCIGWWFAMRPGKPTIISKS